MLLEPPRSLRSHRHGHPRFSSAQAHPPVSRASLASATPAQPGSWNPFHFFHDIEIEQREHPEALRRGWLIVLTAFSAACLLLTFLHQAYVRLDSAHHASAPPALTEQRPAGFSATAPATRNAVPARHAFPAGSAGIPRAVPVHAAQPIGIPRAQPVRASRAELAAARPSPVAGAPFVGNPNALPRRVILAHEIQRTLDSGILHLRPGDQVTLIHRSSTGYIASFEGYAFEVAPDDFRE